MARAKAGRRAVVMKKAEELWGLDPATREGAGELVRRREEVMRTVDLLAAERVEEACELGLLLGQALEHLGDRDGELELVGHLLGIARAAGQPYYEGELLLRQAELCASGGDTEGAADLYAGVLALAQEAGLGVLEVTALGGQAELARLSGNLFKAHGLFARQQGAAAALGEPLLLSQALGNLAATALSMGDYRRGARYARERVGVAREMGDEHGAAQALCSLAMAQRHLGEPGPSVRNYREALTLARKVGDQSLEAAVCYNFASLVNQSEPELAVALLWHAEALATRQKMGALLKAISRVRPEVEGRLSEAALGAVRDGAAGRISALLRDQ